MVVKRPLLFQRTYKSDTLCMDRFVCYVSHLITLSGCMQVQRWTSGAVAWSCTLCCAALCPLMMSTSPRCLRRSEEASSTSQSTWLDLWPLCSCSCCRWTLWREPPSKISGTHPARVSLTEASVNSYCSFLFLPDYSRHDRTSLWSVALVSGTVLCWGLQSERVTFFSFMHCPQYAIAYKSSTLVDDCFEQNQIEVGLVKVVGGNLKLTYIQQCVSSILLLPC